MTAVLGEIDTKDLNPLTGTGRVRRSGETDVAPLAVLVQGCRVEMAYYSESGFAALGAGKPDRNLPHDWLVWHFTHYDNLPKIVKAGYLYPASASQPVTNVGLNSIKDRRRNILVDPDSSYPVGKSVADHVPFYFAAKSPMLFAVTRGHVDYRGGARPLIFLGISIGNIIKSGLLWCASDENASTNLVSFTRDVENLGSFVDFDLLCRRDWYKTPDDLHRPSRRAAEVLVLGRVPIEMITHVVAKDQAALDKAKLAFERVGGSRQYRVEPGFYYD